MGWFKKVLTDERENPSTKRLIAVVGAVCMFVAFLFTAFSGYSLSPSSDLVTGCVTIVCVSLGASSLDKFSIK